MWTRAYRIRLRARRPRLPASREKTPKTHKNKRNLGNLRGRRIWAMPISRARVDFRATPNRYLICCNRAPGVGVMAVFAVREEPRSTGGNPAPRLSRDGAVGEGEVDERERIPPDPPERGALETHPGGRRSGEHRIVTSSRRVRSYQH